MTRAKALQSSLPNPLTPPHEINHAVGPELSTILGRAMAHDPRERFRNADEFREALRRLGRIDDLPESGYDDYAGELYTDRDDSRFGSRALIILMLILLGSFTVFCRYYPWRTPMTMSQGIAPAIDSQVSLNAKPADLQETNRAQSRSGKRKAPVRSSFGRRQ